MSNWLKTEKPTSKQFQTIGYIEENLNITFTGETKVEAQSFISKYIDESRKATRSFNNRQFRESSFYNPFSNIEYNNEKLRDSDRQEMKSWILGSANNSVFCPYDDDEDFRPF
ncbi:hypothetical protein MOC76_16530 [Bacillus spizizenii]|uniref:hypothetical protein n=1 Tax=Bacillus spizizenii TaxID=96241 RepID=UPI00227F30D8|nr:hypothetical protein [Bacillus spizizenii]MCY8063898.1 hypothetical protein [Bacillus spizizenii]MCY8135368.1 hypothetical protein [Bacillus spizizenii]MCY8168773.1 hypothetical protein [Bacillus spizizenii]MCY8256944.1 hypothetical protein [Bacillus spizizenii]MCY8334171.1 hypothetical protein [Bacillus spizizenii]